MTLNWFTQLPSRVVTNFSVLEALFIQHFVAARKFRITSIHLMACKQGEHESLGEYIKRFNAESLEIPNLEGSVAFAALISWLKPNKCKFDILNAELTSFSEVMARAKKHINAADIVNPGGGQKKVDKRKGKLPKEKSNNSKKPRDGDNRDDPRYNINRREIFMAIKDRNELPIPNPMKTSQSRRNKNLWCEYHLDCGHTTQDYRELKKALDKLADDRKLNKYLNKGEGQRRVAESHSGETNGVVGVIAGGFASGGTIKRVCKRHSDSLTHQILDVEEGKKPPCPAMVFNSDTMRSMQFPHDDPLVVEVKVANLVARRVLVDSGSSAYIMTLDCLKELKIGTDNLAQLQKPLVRFGGQATYPEGTINLPMKMGPKGNGRNLMVNFVVVDIPLPYNVILGRPLLNRVKAAISTYQLLFQFETDAGTVGKLYGNQKAGRQWYLNSFKGEATSNHEQKKAVGTSEPMDVELYLTENHKYYTRPTPLEGNEEVVIGNQQNTVQIGASLELGLKEQITAVLREYRDVFAYSPAEMSGIDPSIMEHRLNIKEGSKGVKHKLPQTK
ncbi:Urocanate hydratase [Bienertia sinuspersici]